jgi:hypothetical protein
MRRLQSSPARRQRFTMMMSSTRWMLVAFAACAFAIDASAATFGKIVKISGDRQIVVGPLGTRSGAVTIQAFDSDGLPLANLGMVIQHSASGGRPCGQNRDEFGFAGFSAVDGYFGCGGSAAKSGLTDANGLFARQPTGSEFAPSAFLMAASPQLADPQGIPDIARYQYFSIVRAVNVPPGQPQVVVEYFHDGYRNYFNTIDQGEIDALDAGAFSGWQREVGSFIAWPSQAAAPAGAVSVCRFFASKFTSHFYTADAVECDAVVANFPEWQLETWQAYWILLPDRTSGTCPAGTMPVYRVFKPTSPNHRYVTDRVVRDTMVAAGWLAEGYGPDATIMCTPR